MSGALTLHLGSCIGLFICLLAELCIAKTTLSRAQSYALMITDVLYNLSIYLCLGSGILLVALGPEHWLSQLQNPWLLGKVGLLLLIACFAALPSLMIFSLRNALISQQAAGFSRSRLRGLRLMLASEILLFAVIVWLAQRAALGA